MNGDILNTEVQQFIRNNLNTDIVSLILRKPVFETVSNKELAQQLEARKKCEKKLPTWFRTSGIYYPDKLNIEQTSSEITAWYKAAMVSGKITGNSFEKSSGDGSIESLLDVTGGLGVDSLYFATEAERVVHCEIDENLSRIAAHNLQVLGAENVECIPSNGLEFLKASDRRFDWIYLDPSRRDDEKGKIFRLSECRPEVTENLGSLFSASENILLKTSPLLDFSVGIDELDFVKEIHVVAVKDEVKELLWVLEKGYSGEITIRTINFFGNASSTTDVQTGHISRKKTTKSTPPFVKKGKMTWEFIPFEKFDFQLSQEKKAVADYSHPLSYLYEPNAALLKSGAFKTIGNRFGLQKLHEHSHLYTSDGLIKFPGRRFRIRRVMPYGQYGTELRTLEKANVSIRNFNKTVARLRFEHNIKDGGETYLFFTTDKDEKSMVLECNRISRSGKVVI